ncbi:hypothetical protein Z043_109079 [Scleropages formosus]|uniref:Uncharacterized protein n=1 Tax=Scleropages formosus TaxID=113540 RepID=A0A0N8K0F1_SCLFO|nr:hypothetical protein Z043_109079 [Scleropages formosus]
MDSVHHEVVQTGASPSWGNGGRGRGGGKAAELPAATVTLPDPCDEAQAPWTVPGTVGDCKHATSGVKNPIGGVHRQLSLTWKVSEFLC